MVKRKRIARKRPNEIQPFVRKIYQLLNDARFQSIYWEPELGEHFIIDRDVFEVRTGLVDSFFIFYYLERISTAQ